MPKRKRDDWVDDGRVIANTDWQTHVRHRAN